MAQIKDYLKLHFIVFIFGFTAILGLLISIPAVEMVFYRTLIASLGTAGLLLLRKHNFKIEPGDLVKVSATGILIAAHWITFFLSARIANASVSLVGFSTVALWTALLDPLFSKRKILIYELLLGLFVLAGLYIIFRNEVNNAFGLFVGILSAVFAAIFSIINSRLTMRINPFKITFYEMTGACLSIIIFLPVYKYYLTPDNTLQLQPSLSDWFYLLVLGLVCTVYAFSAWVDLFKRITVFAANLSINLEPVYGIILAIIFFPETEKMRAGFYIGSVIIIAAVLIYPVIRGRENKKLSA